MSNGGRCLTLLGTASIQDYLFRSNRLKENLGASYLVAHLLEEWDDRTYLPRYGRSTLFIGGGNAALIFDSRGEATEAVRAWSREWLEKAPGLRLVAAHQEFAVNGLRDAFHQAQRRLFENENRPPHGAALGQLPVVRECPSTGLAAEYSSDDGWLSGEAHRKRETAETANRNFQRRYSDCLTVNGSPLQFPLDFEDLGQERGASQIAVVHADGNGIGKIFADVTSRCASDGDFQEKLGTASAAISKLAQDAFRATLRDLSAALPELEKQGIRVTAGFYPVRPLVDGGDDLTFVCHGRLGLALAVRYIENFEALSRNHSGDLGVSSLTSCAGVVLVGQRFPFARAYHLAEELAASAKRRRRLAGGEGSWVDFEIIKEGWSGSLRTTRAQYRFGSGLESRDILRRPYRVGSGGPEGWNSLQAIWGEFRDPDRWPRSLAKRLLEALARGQAETEALLKEFASRGRRLPSAGQGAWTQERNGSGTMTWRTPYYDPLDVLDYHVEWPKPRLREQEDVAITD